MWLKYFPERARAEAQRAVHHLEQSELPPSHQALGFAADVEAVCLGAPEFRPCPGSRDFLSLFSPSRLSLALLGWPFTGDKQTTFRGV